MGAVLVGEVVISVTELSLEGSELEHEERPALYVFEDEI